MSGWPAEESTFRPHLGLSPDTDEVGVVPSSCSCQFSPAAASLDDMLSGSMSDSASVLAGTYDLDVACLNATVDCLAGGISWSATY